MSREGDRARSTIKALVTLLGALLLLVLPIATLFHLSGLTGGEPNPGLAFVAGIMSIVGIFLFGWGIGQLYGYA